MSRRRFSDGVVLISVGENGTVAVQSRESSRKLPVEPREIIGTQPIHGNENEKPGSDRAPRRRIARCGRTCGQTEERDRSKRLEIHDGRNEEDESCRIICTVRPCRAADRKRSSLRSAILLEF